MNTRTAKPEDFEMLRKIHAQSGLDFPIPDLDSPMIEGIELVIDGNGEIMLAAVAQKTAEIYLLAPAGHIHPLVKMKGILLLHSGLRDKLALKGYKEFFAFVHPAVERSFGRHLRKWFGWERTWAAWRIVDWKGEPKDA